MKKVLLFVAAIFAVVALNAQTYLLQESFDAGSLPTGWITLDQDGDGYTWDAESPVSNGFAPYAGAGCISSASYVNNVGALTPDNWLITPALNIPTGESTVISWWVAGQDPNFCAEHYEVLVSTSGTAASDFNTTPIYEETVATGRDDYQNRIVDLSAYAGQTIYIAFVHNETTDMFWLNLDEVSVYSISGATIMVGSTALDFGNVVTGREAVLSTSVTGVGLNAAVSVSTTAPYSVSSDGTTFGTTASIPATGGTLYVKFAPTAVGAANGTVTLTSDDANTTIALSGNGFECTAITTFPYTCTFAEDDATLSCWEIIDVNGDANVEGEDQGTWNFTGSGWSSDNDGVAQYFYSEANAADDWLISPEFLGTGLSASFDYLVRGSSYPEEFSVYVIAPGQTYTNATEVIPAQNYTNTDFVQHTIDLSAYDNQNIRIAIHATSDANMYGIVIDNFVVSATTDIAENINNAISIYPNPATSILNVNANGYNEVQIINMLGQVVYNTTMNDNAQINVRNLNDGVYFVRLNGANGTTTQKFIKK